MVFAMVLGGLNFGNNLGLGLAFLLASIGLVAMHHCHGNLLGLELRLAGTESAFAGGEVVFRLLLENRSVTARPQVELATGAAPASVTDVTAAGQATVELRLPAERRGRVPLARYTVATRHPLGLFRAWAVVHGEHHAIAWPAPAARGRTPPGVETDTGGAQDRAQGEHDFAGYGPSNPRLAAPHRVEGLCARPGPAHQAVRGHRRGLAHLRLGGADRVARRRGSRRSAAGCSMHTSVARPTACACPGW